MSTSEFTPTEDDLRDHYTVFRQTGEDTFAYDDVADALEFNRAIAKIKAEAVTSERANIVAHLDESADWHAKRSKWYGDTRDVEMATAMSEVSDALRVIALDIARQDIQRGAHDGSDS